MAILEITLFTNDNYAIMENQKRRFDVFLRMFGANNFYSVGFCEYDIKLQGHFHSDIVKLAFKHKFTQRLRANGYVEFKRGQYEIILTE